VKVREVRKRSACYDSLRKAYVPRRAQIKMYFGNYRFVVEFDAGSETGSNQLTIWFTEKADIEAVPLKQFGTAQSLNALTEPERSRLHAKLEEERCVCQQPCKLEFANLQQPFRAVGEKQG
jgi:hypothetical protein